MSLSARFDVVDHLPALNRYALALARNQTEANDLVHDALVLAYERRASYQTDSDLRLWLFAILHNRFIDGIRARSVRAAYAARERHVAVASFEATQEEGVWLGQVRAAVEQLPDEQRAALHLVAVEGMSYAEAAQVLDIPLGTLMSRLGRARLALRMLAETEKAKPVRRLRVVGDSDEP